MQSVHAPTWRDYFVVSEALSHRIHSIQVLPSLTKPHHAVLLTLHGRQPHEHVWTQRTKRRFAECDSTYGLLPVATKSGMSAGMLPLGLSRLTSTWPGVSGLLLLKDPRWQGRGAGPLRKCVPLEQAYSVHRPYTPDSYAWRRLAVLATRLMYGRVKPARRPVIIEAAFSSPQVLALPPLHMLGGVWIHLQDLQTLFATGLTEWWVEVLNTRSRMEDAATRPALSDAWACSWQCPCALAIPDGFVWPPLCTRGCLPVPLGGEQGPTAESWQQTCLLT
eukprot:5289530-Amphidinium_carterae.1